MEKLIDYGRKMLKKFHTKPEENMELRGQLKSLPDEEVRHLHEGYPSNLHIKREMMERGLKK